jgi:4-amino-4-deoxy-L-arabinose transferase-like glycosyltransferase
MWLIADAALLAAVIWTRKPAHLDTAPTQIPRSISDMSDFGERARPRARGSAPPLNPLPDVSDEGVADHTRGRVCSPEILSAVAAKKPSAPLWNPALLVLLSAFILLIGLLALECPTTIWDSLTYHVPRVMHWLQQRSLSPYPTNIPRQLESAPGAELQTSSLALLTGDDWALNLPQWWALLTCGLLASLMAERLLKWHFGKLPLDPGRVRWCGLFAALIAVTLPSGVIEAISPLNDFLAAQWVLLLALFGLLLIQEPGNYFYAAAIGASLALGVNNKPTMFIYAAPLAAALALWLARKSLRMLAAAGIAAAVLGLAANAPWMARNCEVFHHPLGSAETRRIQPLADHSPAKMAANVFRNLALYTDTPFDWSTSALNRPLGWMFNLAGEPLDDEGSVWASLHFSFPKKSQVKKGDGLGGIMAVLPLLLAAAFFLKKFNWKSPLLIYLGLILAGFLLFCGYLRWQPWHQRLHLPLLVLAAPLAGLVLGWVWNRWLVLAASLLLVVNALLVLYYNPNYPVYQGSEFWSRSREEQYFSQRPELYAGMAEMAHDIVASGVTNVCLNVGPDTWEYQFWVCLKNRGFQGVIQHAFVTNESSVLAAPDFDLRNAAFLCTAESKIPTVDDFGLRVCYSRWAAYYQGKPEERIKLVANQMSFNTHFKQPSLLQIRCNPVDQRGLPMTNNVIRLQVGNLARDFPVTSGQVVLEWHFPAGTDTLMVYCVNPPSAGQRIMTLANWDLKVIPEPP